MKLWVSFIVAGVWAAHLPSEGNAKALRELSATNKGEYPDLDTILKDMPESEKDRKESMIIAASLVVRRKFPEEDYKAYRDHVSRISSSLTPDDLKRDDLPSVLVKKYRDGTDYTAEDEAFYKAYKEITDDRKLMEKIGELGLEKCAVYAVGRSEEVTIDSFMGMTIAELKSPNFLQILGGKLDTFIANKVKNI